MSVLTTPWTRNALGLTRLAQLEAAVPRPYSLMLSGRSAHGPWTVRLSWNGRLIFDREHVDLVYLVGAAMALVNAVPTLEEQLAASLELVR